MRTKYHLHKIIQSCLGCEFWDLPFINHMKWYIYKLLYIEGGSIKLEKKVKILSPHNGNHKMFCGADVVINNNVFIDATGNVRIGNNVLISEGVTIYSHKHIESQNDCLGKSTYIPTTIEIEHDCWIGAHSIILPNVKKIGYGSVVAAGSIVTKEIPPMTVVGGNPAKVIKKRELKG